MGTIYHLVGFLIGIAFLFGAVTLVFLERAVLSRLHDFSRDVARIAESGNLGGRTRVPGSDELGALSSTVNGMLASLEVFESERQAATVQLQLTTSRAEAASRAKSVFLANMSHELRTPMNAIIGFSELLDDERFGELNPKQRKYVANILSSGRHLLQLINDILDLSKIEVGRMELSLETFRVADVLSDVAAVVRSLAIQKQIRLSVEPDDTVGVLTADPAKFKQIIYNLLSNAIKFTPDTGSVTVRASLSPLPCREVPPQMPEGPHLWLSVRDSGIGIKPQDRERVFIQFEQLDSSYARKQQGTGLGLALTRQLVGMHFGRIWLESEGEGKGTTFYVVLPLAPPPPQERIQAIGDGSPARLPGRQSPYPPAAPPEDDRRPLVLVVEDERSLATQIARCLNEAGYAVAHAWNGLEALEIARELHPLAITLDIFLPGKDGWGVLKELKAEPETQGIPVVLLSLAGDPERAARWGAAACLSKPLAEDKLVRTVNELVEERRSQMMLVLVVDDAASDRQLLRDRLRGEGYTVISAPNGPDGIALALARRPDAMVLDLVMDGMSGYDVVEQLRSRPEAKDLPILICTAHDLTLEDRQRLGTAVQGIAKKGNLQRLVQDLATLTPKVRGPWNKGREVHA